MKHDQLFLTIRRLFTADDTTLDMESLLLVIRLLVQRADENPAWLSKGTIARQMRCSESTVENRMQKLKAAGILAIKSGKRLNMPNDVTVLINKLPQGDLKSTTVSSEAKRIAGLYKTVMLQNNPRRRFQAGTLQRWEYTIQWLLDKKCMGDSGFLIRVINTALNHPEYTKDAQRGPDRIKKRWSSLFTEYSAAHSMEIKQNA